MTVIPSGKPYAVARLVENECLQQSRFVALLAQESVSKSFCHFQIGPVAKVKLFFQPQAVGYHIGIVVGTKSLPYIGYGVFLRILQCEFLFPVESYPTFRSVKRKGKTGIGRGIRLIVFGKIFFSGSRRNDRQRLRFFIRCV